MIGKDLSVSATIVVALLLSAVVGCPPEEGGEGAEIGTARVTLVANDASLVHTFGLYVREASVTNLTTYTLTPVVIGNQAEASVILSLVPGNHLFRAVALDSVGDVIGLPREVWATITPGATTTVDIELDLADFGEGDSGTAEVTVTAQNGAHLDQSSLTNSNPTDAISTTITIDLVTDHEGDTIRTGFFGQGVVFQTTPEFFDGSTTVATFTLNAAHLINQRVYAMAVDDHSFGTAHAYSFDISQNPSFQGVETWRVADVVSVDGGPNDMIVLAKQDAIGNHQTAAFADWNQDGNWNASIADPVSLLSWGIDPNNPTSYVIRTIDQVSTFEVHTFDFNAESVTTVLE